MKRWQLLIATATLTLALVAPADEGAASTSTYTVQKGDTLTKIAQTYGMTVADLKKLNNLQDNAIYLAQSLKVPIKAVNATQNAKKVVIAPTATTAQIVTYKVEKGDTLTKIATKNSTTLSKLKAWNNLASDTIFVGQILKIRTNEDVSMGQTAVLPNNPSSNNIASADTASSAVDLAIQTQLAKEKVNTATLTASASKKYSQVLSVANTLIGTPYVFGGDTPEGIDCSGFVNYVYKNAGFEITRKSSLNYFMQDTVKVDKPVPGDLVFFKNTYIATISHMGIYLGDDQFIHASSNGVEITKLSYNYWDSRFVAFKRFTHVK